MAVTGSVGGLELQSKPRRWSQHWLACFGRCTPAGWKGCCLAHCCPCVAFGCNARKVLHRSFWLEALKYLLVLCLVGFVYAAVQVLQASTCPVKEATETTSAHGEIRACDVVFGLLHILFRGAGIACSVFWAVHVGGPRRRQIREALGIPVTDPQGACCTGCHNEGDKCNSDCCLHYWCLCCALAQETRTVLDAEREQRDEWADCRKPLLAVPGQQAMMERSAAGEKLLLPV